MTNLKEARKKGKLEEFIKEHENDAPVDNKRLEKALNRASQDKKKSTQETSK